LEIFDGCHRDTSTEIEDIGSHLRGGMREGRKGRSGRDLLVPARGLVDQIAKVFEIPILNSLQHLAFTSLRNRIRTEATTIPTTASLPSLASS
jgi:hypothetical protein